MKSFLKMFGAFGLVAAMLMAGGCGSDNDVAPVAQGKVVKGPVVGAVVKDSKGVVVGTTDAKGNFPMTGTGPYSTTGGTYIPLNADGTEGTAIAAPPMSAPAGVSQITPLSTLVQTATVAAAVPGADQAVLTKLLAVINANGGLNTDLSAKTTTNAALLNLNETVGAVLATTATTSSASLPAAQTALITAVATLSATTPITNVATIVAAVQTQVTAALPALATQLNAAAATASAGATEVDNGTLPAPPATTGSTGGTVAN